MRGHFVRSAAVLTALLILIGICAGAEDAISTTVLMRVSRMTQNAVVRVGEELSIEIGIDGVEPARYQWYFNDAPIEGAIWKVYNIVDASPADTGVYRMDAFDANGNMLVSMDIAVRVVEEEVPHAGDGSLPVGFAFAGLAACGALLAALLRRRRLA